MALTVVALLLCGLGRATADNIFLDSNAGDPWGSSDYQNAMNQAFGAAGWSRASFEATNPNMVFNASNHFVYVEGSDLNANALSSYLAANSSLITSWVNAGGSLFLDAAPNEGGNIALPFGATINYPEYSFTATAVNPLHPIFQGPFTPVATSYSGNYFSHSFVTGPGLSSIIINDVGDSVLSEANEGSGHVLYGGMTAPQFHSPNQEANNLLANILDYGEDFGTQSSAVPEPATLTMLGFGVAGLLGYGWRKRRQTATVAA